MFPSQNISYEMVLMMNLKHKVRVPEKLSEYELLYESCKFVTCKAVEHLLFR